jgi:hypothetical protein
MKIKARASGGFAGRTDCYELDTACAADGKSVEELVHQLDFFGAEPACGVGADLQRWEITVDDGGRRRTVTVLDDGSPGGQAWQTLLAHLRNSV